MPVDQSPAVTSFLEVLSEWDKQEIETKLNQRVEFSKRAVCKLLQAYDRLLQRNEKLWDAIKEKAAAKEESEDGDAKDAGDDVKDDVSDDKNVLKAEVKVKAEPSDAIVNGGTIILNEIANE